MRRWRRAVGGWWGRMVWWGGVVLSTTGCVACCASGGGRGRARPPCAAGEAVAARAPPPPPKTSRCHPRHVRHAPPTGGVPAGERRVGAVAGEGRTTPGAAWTPARSQRVGSSPSTRRRGSAIAPPPPAIVHVDADAPWPSHVPTAAALARISLGASAFARLQEGAARGQPGPSRGTSNKRWVGSAWLCQGTRPLRRLPPRRGPHRDRKRGWVTRLGMVAAVGGPPPGTVDRYCTRPRLADWAGTFTRGQAMPARLGWSWGPLAASVVSRGAMTGLRRGAGS